MFTIVMTWTETASNGIATTEDAWYASEGVFCFNKVEAATMHMKHALRIARTLAADSKFTDNCGYNIKLTKVRVVRA